MKNWMKLIWTSLKGIGAMWITVKFGLDAEYLIKVLIVDNVALGVPWSVILQQTPVLNLLALIAVTVIGLELTYDEFNKAIDLGRRMLNKDYREVEQTIRLIRKESRRLKKLEGC